MEKTNTAIADTGKQIQGKRRIEAAAGAWRHLLQCDMCISRQPVASLYSTRKESTSDKLQNHAFLFHTACLPFLILSALAYVTRCHMFLIYQIEECSFFCFSTQVTLVFAR